MDKIQAMLELERRGKLPEQFVPLLAEARNRGLIPGGAEPEQADPVNPDGTYGQPPEGVVTNPQTGQMTERSLLANHMQQNGVSMPESAVIGAAEGATFGGADEGVGALYSIMPGEGSIPDRYAFGREYARAMQESSQAENPWTHGISEVAGAMSVPLGALDRTAKGAGLVKRGAQSAAVGTGIGGTYGFLSGEGGPTERLESLKTGAKWGLAGGAIAPVVGAGVNKIADGVVGRKAVRAAAAGAPTTDTLRAQGNAAFKAINDAGVSVNADSFRNKATGIVDDMIDGGLDNTGGALSLTPKSARIAQLLTETTDGANTVPFSKVHQLRRKAAIPAGDISNKVEQKLGSEVIDGLDDFIANLDEPDIDAGDVEALKTMWPKAMQTWARMRRSETIDDAIEAAGNYQSGKASGLANQFRSILNNPKRSRGFSEGEQKLMRRVVDGTMPEKIVRYMGSGLGMMGQMVIGGAGGAALGPLGILLGTGAGAATAAGSRKLTEKIATKNAEIARAIVANGGMKALPKAPDSVRRITEMLTRRGVAAGPQ